jgi:ATP-dependent Clp protease ATP-binding subunit ClpA
MFERYTERARRVLFFARYEASQLGSISIDTEHLLLGLIREGKGLTSRIFARAHVSLEHVRKEIEGRTVFREKISTSVEIPFSQEAKRILQFAADEADRLLHDYIGTEHLLLGIFREERSVAASILMEMGMRLESVRHDVQTLKAGSAHVESAGEVAGLPRYLPSEIVHLSVSHRGAETVSSEGPQHWIMTCAELGAILVRAYGTDKEHLLLPAGLVDHTRFDVVLTLPREESAETRARLVQQALEKQFRLAVNREAGPGGDVVVVRQLPAA